MPQNPLVCLIVEDQDPVAQALEVLFSLHDVPRSRRSGRRRPRSSGCGPADVGVVLQDMNFAPGETSGDEGAALFHAIRGVDPAMPVLLMTAFTSLERAVSLVKAGATDYFGKPWDDARLVASVRELLAMREARRSGDRSGSAVAGIERHEVARTASQPDLCGLVFQSDAMARLVDLAVHVAAADVPVLITGPNGAGKEKIARIIQANSTRAGRAFVTVNVGALPDTLLEAELFGAEAGAFTGAQRRRVGRFEAAHGGTLFLDEIGTLSLPGQAKLLRVLQTGEYERLGSSTSLHSDVRLLCATNVHLPTAIAAGLFREDLYFRLNVIELAVPALRDRPDDILPIARQMLSGQGRTRTLGAAAERALLAYGWPGNVRELENRLQRARLVASGEEIGPEDLGLAIPAASSLGAAALGERVRSRPGREHVRARCACGGAARPRRQRVAGRGGARVVAAGPVPSDGAARRLARTPPAELTCSACRPASCWPTSRVRVRCWRQAPPCLRIGMPALMAAASALAVGLVVGLAAARIATSPARQALRALHDGVTGFAESDFATRLASPSPDEVGDLVSVFNRMGAILREERAELIQRELLLDTLLQGAPMAILLLDQRQRIVFANAACRRVFHGAARLNGRLLAGARGTGSCRTPGTAATWRGQPGDVGPGWTGRELPHPRPRLSPEHGVASARGHRTDHARTVTAGDGDVEEGDPGDEPRTEQLAGAR